MSEAVKVRVTGFKTQHDGNLIASRLEEAGFAIKDKMECSCEGCRGGYVETAITSTDDLDGTIDRASFEDISTDITAQLDHYEQVQD